jgi:hypothetical protein
VSVVDEKDESEDKTEWVMERVGPLTNPIPWRPFILGKVWQRKKWQTRLGYEFHTDGSMSPVKIEHDDCTICDRHICQKPECDSDKEYYESKGWVVCLRCFGQFPDARVEGT